MRFPSQKEMVPISKVTWKEKLCYGLSSVGGNLPNYLVVGYLTLFATDVMDIDASKAGTIIMLCSIFDAITDLFVTNLADRTHTRWGKYRPWLLFTGVPMTVILVLLFWYPSFLTTESQKLLRLTICFFLLSPVFLTGYLCPQYILLSVISNNEAERLSLGSARSIGEFASDLLVNGLCMTTVLALSGGDHRDIGSWRTVILLFAMLTLGCCLAGFFGTKERVQIANTDTDGVQLTLKDKLTILLHSKIFLRVLLLNAGIMLATVESVLFSYFCIYCLGHEQWLSVLCTIASIAAITATAVLPWIGRRAGKRAIIFLGCVSLGISALFCLLADGFVTALLFVIFKGVGYGFCISCSGVLLAASGDHIESETGIAIPGLVMAMGSFICKILMGICTFLGTQILTLAQYRGDLAVQSVETQNQIRYSMAGFLLLAAMITTIANLMLKKLHEFQPQEKIAQ